MIVRILSHGKSFTGLAMYLAHDPEAKTEDRVNWTHTLNLGNDHVPSAVDEMLWTARNAELLKQEAGIRAGGRTTENPVKHFSLNWSSEDRPTQEHMIETVGGFLKHMKWDEHQAILFSHTDKPYAHVHVMLNVVNSETGLRLNDGFEHYRAQKWAAEYEREQGRIYCKQRLVNPDEREKNMPRHIWTAFRDNQEEFERSEKRLERQVPILIGDGKNPEMDFNSAEWQILKEIQKADRKEFFAEGKLAFKELRNSIYREVRQEFSDRWSNYYGTLREGGDKDALAEIKAKLVADQKAVLEARRDKACEELREARDGLYRQLLENQRHARHELHERQEAGLDSTVLLELEQERRGTPRTNVRADFREAAVEVASGRQDSPEASRPDASDGKAWPGREGRDVRSPEDIGANLAGGIGFGIISLLESVADGIIGSTPAPKPRRAASERAEANPFDAIIEEARKRQRHEQEEADREWRKRQRSYGE